MDGSALRRLLEDVQGGRLQIDDALTALRGLPYEDLGFAKVDHHRELRNGFPEVIYCPGKTPAEAAAIAERILARGQSLLGTRAEPEVFEAVQKVAPDAEYNARARTFKRLQGVADPPHEGILIVSAGTADLQVAEEALETASAMGQKAERLYDVGVAGLHRLLDNAESLYSARVIVVAAGMEGALPSVVGGLVSAPVIAVPTSAGYGANFGGVAPLLAMLNSCASGVTVVNIDNGFGAGYAASLINRLVSSAGSAAERSTDSSDGVGGGAGAGAGG